MTVTVSIDGVGKSFGEYQALQSVSLEIKPGELVALLGPSGSGKTTLLRLIAGLETTDQGTIRFDGVDSRGLSLRDRRIGMVFQSYALFKHMRVFDNIAYGLRARPRAQRPSGADIRQRVEALLDLVQLGGLGSRFPSQLSGGQRQRVALARALAIEPRVLLLDEPFGALDAKVRRDLREWLRQLHRKTGHTTVFVTHDQAEALELADRIAVLNGGRIEQMADPDTLHDRPATPSICDFLGYSIRLPVQLQDTRVLFQGEPVMALREAISPCEGVLYARPQGFLTRSLPFAVGSIAAEVMFSRRGGHEHRLWIKVAGIEQTLEIAVRGEAPPTGSVVYLSIVQACVFRRDEKLTPDGGGALDVQPLSILQKEEHESAREMA